MGEVLGLGISHFPLFGGVDEGMAAVLQARLRDPGVPQSAKDPRNWPALMIQEWGDDEGCAAAAGHRAAMLKGLRKVREELDRFKPDFVVVWGDDQYENFQEDIVPAFCVMAYDDFEVKPWAQAAHSTFNQGKPNVWGEDKDATFSVRGAHEQGKMLADQLIRTDFDVAYSYKPLHHPGLPHAFLNSMLFLDYDRRGFPYPLVPFQINCYGELVISYKGFMSELGDKGRPLDPRAPSPTRCFDMGAQVARICRDSSYRVALIASSSWSHAFLTDKTWRMMPDIEIDRQLYRAMIEGDYQFWCSLTREDLVDSGQHELLNWYAMLGAMDALGQRCTWADMVETYVFNSTKVSAVFLPA